MVMKSNYKVAIGILVISAIYFGYLFYPQTPVYLSRSAEVPASVDTIEVEGMQTSQLDTENINAQPEVIESVSPSTERTIEQYNALADWNETRGYYSRADRDTYNSYSEDTLKSLSVSGDVKAMMVLASYYIQKDYRPDEAVQQLQRAAAFGATTALPRLGSMKEADVIASGSDKTEVGREAAVVDILAYFEVASMRGDPRASIPYLNAYKETYKMRYGNELVLTPELQTKISSKATEIYADLQRSRVELGLGSFDNFTNEEVNQHYSSK